MKDITNTILDEFRSKFLEKESNIVAMNATTSNGIEKSALNCFELREINHQFSISIPTGDITNQKQSGRCWMFAGLNFLRLEVMKNLNMKTIELSQSYPLFYDKLEKSNYFLENIIETKDEDLDSRYVQFLLKDPLQDGGQWDMFKSLVKKYGVVPKDVMPEVVSSSATKEMDRYLTLKLREFARDIRNDKNLSLVELREKKKDMLDEVYRILSICLGTPPQSFDFEYRDKDDRFFKINNITPVEFFEKYVKINLDDYVSVINAPTDDKPFGRCFTVKFLGNVVDGSPVNYLNLPIGDLKMLAIKQMKDNVPVWFGSDVGQFSTRVEGILSKNILDVDKLFSTNFTMTKADRLNYGESLMTHAMLLTGVDLDDDQPTRYRIENSWGKDVGKDGFYVMTDEWFSEFVYQVVINKKYLSNEHLKMLDDEVIKLEPWDPRGSLARVKELLFSLLMSFFFV